MDQPSNRQIIKVISTHSRSELYMLQGISDQDHHGQQTEWLHFMLRAFLILTNLLSGTLSGITCCIGKLLIMVFVSPGVVADPLSLFKMKSAWLLALCVNISVWSNLFNLNLTVSLYSQLITMPTYECCILLGTFMSGGVVMGEFSYYTSRQLMIILLGLCTCMGGIMYKVCMLENADIEDDEYKKVHGEGEEQTKAAQSKPQLEYKDLIKRIEAERGERK